LFRKQQIVAALMLAPLGANLRAQAPTTVTNVQTIQLRGDRDGKRFDGIGVVEGGGGTGVLLKDYPEPQRSQILDLMFKPKFGASISALLVEIPGDGNSTQGSMPSHMHSRDDLNYRRGYMWWELREAKRRNPRLSLDGAAWSAPGWLGTSGTLFAQNGGEFDRNFYSQDTIDYYVEWLRGLRDVYRLEFDAIGSRNEKGVSYGFAKAFRKSLDANGFRQVRLHGFDNWPDEWKFAFVPDLLTDAELRKSLDIVSAHINAPESVVPAEVQSTAAKVRKPIWNTEQHVYKAGFDGLIGIVEAFNENYIRSGVTKVVNWYGIAGLYTMEPYSGEKEAAIRANWPWSGHYGVNPSLWGYAHYGQFSEAGWQYLNGGSGDLAAGGTYVTLKSPGSDYSIIAETKDARNGQRVRFTVGRGLSKRSLAVWRSDRSAQFVRQADIAVRGGEFTLTLAPDSVYSITTTRGQRKGSFGQELAQTAFPFPYRETFDRYVQPAHWGYLPRYFADISGAFEVSACPGRTGMCLRQAVPMHPISWAPDWKPYTVIGDDQWRDYEVAADLHLGPGESGGIMGRVNHVGTGYGTIPKGYFLQLDSSGLLQLIVVRGKADKKVLTGDSEQQALIRAQNDASPGGEKLLGSVKVAGVAPGQWHRLRFRFEGSMITALVDERPVLGVRDSLYANGMAGLLAGRDGDRMSTPFFDEVVIKQSGQPDPAPVPAVAQPKPLYPGAN
jgi:galactosylceramidase